MRLRGCYSAPNFQAIATAEYIEVRLGTFNFGMAQEMYTSKRAWRDRNCAKSSNTLAALIDGGELDILFVLSPVTSPYAASTKTTLRHGTCGSKIAEVMMLIPPALPWTASLCVPFPELCRAANSSNRNWLS